MFTQPIQDQLQLSQVQIFSSQKSIFRGFKPIESVSHQYSNNNSVIKQKYRQQQVLNNRPLIEIPDSSFYPFSAVGVLEHKSNNIIKRYTAFLIHPRIILTAAQNLIDSLNQKSPQIMFYPSQTKQGYKVRKVFICESYFEGIIQNDINKITLYNYSAAQLQTQIATHFGYLGIDFSQQRKDEPNFHLSFLSAPQIAKGPKIYFGINQGKMQLVQGEIGSPIIYVNNQTYFVVGMRAKDNVIVNKQLRENLNRWFKQASYSVNLCRKNLDSTHLSLLFSNKQYDKPIKKLYLDHHKFTNQAFGEFCNLPLQQLEQIWLNWNFINDINAAYLSKSQWPNLKYIRLNWNQISQEGIKSLTNANWKQLHRIELDSNGITDQGVKYLTNAQWLKLTFMRLNNNKISDLGVKYLRQGNWPDLTRLEINANKIGLQGVMYLKSNKWEKLQRIQMAYNKLGNQGVLYIIDRYCEDWRNIQFIGLKNNQISQQLLEYVKQLRVRNCNNTQIRFIV